LRLV